MILRGILDRSLSSQLCIRGFAPIKELARISKADYHARLQKYIETPIKEDLKEKGIEFEDLVFPHAELSCATHYENKEYWLTFYKASIINEGKEEKVEISYHISSAEGFEIEYMAHSTYVNYRDTVYYAEDLEYFGRIISKNELHDVIFVERKQDAQQIKQTKVQEEQLER